MALAGFMALNLNIYLLDFFSLARGYGLGCAFLMASLYWLAVFLEKQRLTTLASMLLCAALAVLSNFVFLNFFAALAIMLCLLLVFKLRDSLQSRELFGYLALVSVFSVGLLSLIRLPLTVLSKKAEFQYGVSSLWETILSIVKPSLSSKTYLGENTLFILSVLLSVGLAFCWLKSLWIWLTHKAPFFRFDVTIALIVAIQIVLFIFQHYFIGTQYPHNRTALLLIPTFSLVLFTCIDTMLPKVEKVKFLVSSLIIVFCLSHFSLTANLNFCREWKYDSETKNMVFWLKNELGAEKLQNTSLGTFWLFSPTVAFYGKTQGILFKNEMRYEKALIDDNRFDYYYVRPRDAPQLKDRYEVVHKFGYEGILLKRR